MKVKSLSRVRLLATPRTAAHQAPPWDFPGIFQARVLEWGAIAFPYLPYVSVEGHCLSQGTDISVNNFSAFESKEK